MTRPKVGPGWLDSPLRAVAGRNVSGDPIGDGAQGYRDGAEQRVLEIIRQAGDIGSLSDELRAGSTTWAEEYHLSPDRANILRALDLRSTDRVLEIGAGCGAITRYLGEACALVDAIEPEQVRGQVARERTRDLASVHVHVGIMDDVPEVAFYDVAVVVGVLEYVGRGSEAAEPYVEFLTKIVTRLAPDGVLICAIENQLGIKYLCGSPEDHTGRPFDGLTGYPHGTPARTFTRGQLAALFEGAKLKPAFAHAFPDYKMARVVLSDEVFSPRYEWLATELPHFPSPDRVPGWTRVADEQAGWRAVVRAGEGAKFANSFLVIGSKAAASTRWRDGRLATFYSERRAAIFRTETSVDEGDPVRFTRVNATPDPVRAGSLVHLDVNVNLVDGERLDLLMERVTWPEISRLLARWRDLVADTPHLVDLIPPNIRVSEGGLLTAFDQEWHDETYGAVDVLSRGLLGLSARLHCRSRELLGRDGISTREMATELGACVGLGSEGDWIDRAVDREAALQATVATGAIEGLHWHRARDSIRDSFLAVYSRPIPPAPRPPIAQRAARRLMRAFRVLIHGS